MRPPKPGDVADLVRLPSVLSVPGDVLLGAAASGGRERPIGTAGCVAASSCLYMAGMALNDYADRRVDAEERPERPIPSGRVSPGFALGLATGLTAAGAGLAYVSGGRRALVVALPLAACVWGYDLAAKRTRWGPLAMALCRFLDVLLGASGSRRSWPAAGVVGAHTFVITTVSRREAQGGTKNLALASLAGTAALASTAARLSLGASGAGRFRRLLALGLLGAHAATMVAAELEALSRPTARNLQRVVGTGVLGMMPLEAGMLAGLGKSPRALALACGWWLARRLARKRSVT